ncbi:MAG: glycosyltransferase family 4 protein [Anaerolineales bacterium]|nr:glycosyltransferase family 4 protein [Anaerolineales bacterium]
MKILLTLTYYRPHYSGLTIYAERLAMALARRGHTVTVLTSQFRPDLPRLERLDGVIVVRVPPLVRVSKGLLMPGMPFLAWKLARRADVVNLHMPQLDAAYITWIARLLHKPVVLTYQCDLRLPRGLIHAIANQVSHVANHVAALGSDAIASITQDYADHSPYLMRYIDRVRVINAPVELAQAGAAEVRAFREKYGLQPGQRVIGMAARLATEKGVEVLVQALPEVLKHFPTARVLFVGPYQNVVGEEKYAERILPLIHGLEEHWTFLGIIPDVEMTAFFKTCEVLAFPSLNSTEGYGLSQVEAMTCGTPVVSSDLPGVRVPVGETGMGQVVPLGDPAALARAIVAILSAPERFRGDPDEVRRRTSPDVMAAAYESLFAELAEKKSKR